MNIKLEYINPVQTLDLDLTNDCCFGCTYCYKGKKNKNSISLEVAKKSIDWLIDAAGDIREIKINFMGGEPLMCFDMIKEIVPYGKRRANAYGKRLHFGATTNMALINEEVIRFWKKWGMGFHTSIDGIPKIQDKSRPFKNGSKSSNIIEKNIPLILEYRGNVAARATYTPETITYLKQSTLYFIKLGYSNIIFSPALNIRWNKKDFKMLSQKLDELIDIYVDRYRNNNNIDFEPFDGAIKKIVNPTRNIPHCGAGRGMVAIDINGNIWPCHRWTSFGQDKKWILGNLWDGINNNIREMFISFNSHYDIKADCENCIAVNLCSGGCIAENISYEGDIYQPNKNWCEIARILFMKAQKIHYILCSENNKLFLSKFYNNKNVQDKNHSDIRN